MTALHQHPYPLDPTQLAGVRATEGAIADLHLRRLSIAR